MVFKKKEASGTSQLLSIWLALNNADKLELIRWVKQTLLALENML